MKFTANDVIRFWFQEIDRKLWFQKSSEFDQTLRDRFLTLHADVRAGRAVAWRATPEGRLAEILVLDQFSRNMFRETPEAFASDDLALTLAREAIARGADRDLPPDMRGFLYMPYMHSESKDAHAEAMRLFDQPGLENALKFEVMHKEIIDRFGRYPHRNKILGRASTPEETEFLKTPGSSF